MQDLKYAKQKHNRTVNKLTKEMEISSLHVNFCLCYCHLPLKGEQYNP